MSQEVEDNRLPDDQRLAEPPDHWVQHAYEYVTQADLDEVRAVVVGRMASSSPY